MALDRSKRRQKIRYQIRSKVSGSGSIPRLSVFRSNKQIYAQLVDDEVGTTLCNFSSLLVEGDKDNKTTVATKVGAGIAKLAVEKGINQIVFDRGGYLYHGRVKALAEGARDGGLKF